MARKAHTAPAKDSQEATARAEQAYQAYTALQRTAAREPDLLANDYFCALLDTANARFRSLFEVL